MRFVVLTTLLWAGCEDAIPPGDAAVVLDLQAADLSPSPDGSDLDGGGAPDPVDAAGPPAIRGVPCGGGVCYADANQYCHTSDWGGSGSCQMLPAPEPGYFACDGPEDCQTGACCLLDSASVCGLYGFCVAGNVVGEFMCHTDAECGQQSRCCRKASVGTFKACVDGLGPTDPCPPVP